MTRPPPPGHPLSEQQRHDASLDRIGDALLDAVPDGWRRVDLMVKMSVAVQDLALTVYLADGSTREVVPPDSLLPEFVELRRSIYRPGRGAWFSARLSIDPPGSVRITYNLDHDPGWVPPIPAAHWARDLEMFPRDERFVPDWLRARIEEARHEGQNA